MPDRKNEAYGTKRIASPQFSFSTRSLEFVGKAPFTFQSPFGFSVSLLRGCAWNKAQSGDFLVTQKELSCSTKVFSVDYRTTAVINRKFQRASVLQNWLWRHEETKLQGALGQTELKFLLYVFLFINTFSELVMLGPFKRFLLLRIPLRFDFVESINITSSLLKSSRAAQAHAKPHSWKLFKDCIRIRRKHSTWALHAFFVRLGNLFLSHFPSNLFCAVRGILRAAKTALYH